jgi:hypothetical protein
VLRMQSSTDIGNSPIPHTDAIRESEGGILDLEVSERDAQDSVAGMGSANGSEVGAVEGEVPDELEEPLREVVLYRSFILISPGGREVRLKPGMDPAGMLEQKYTLIPQGRSKILPLFDEDGKPIRYSRARLEQFDREGWKGFAKIPQEHRSAGPNQEANRQRQALTGKSHEYMPVTRMDKRTGRESTYSEHAKHCERCRLDRLALLQKKMVGKPIEKEKVMAEIAKLHVSFNSDGTVKAYAIYNDLKGTHLSSVDVPTGPGLDELVDEARYVVQKLAPAGHPIVPPPAPPEPVAAVAPVQIPEPPEGVNTAPPPPPAPVAESAAAKTEEPAAEEGVEAKPQTVN